MILLSRNIEIVPSESRADYCIVTQSANQRIDAITLSQRLRKQGKKVILDDSISKEKPDKVSKQLSRANQLNSKYSLIIFPEEWQDKKVVIKDMQNGEQQIIDISSLLETQPKSD